MTYDEAVKYIKRYTDVYGLHEEVMDAFKNYNEAEKSRDQVPNYAHNAWCALYDWDI